MGKQGESHHIPPSVPSPESEALWARMHARAHSCIAQTSRCSRFSVQDRTFYQTFSTRPATNMQNIPPCEIPACLLVHPLRLRRGGGQTAVWGGDGRGVSKTAPWCDHVCVVDDDNKYILKYRNMSRRLSEVLRRAAARCTLCATLSRTQLWDMQKYAPWHLLIPRHDT